MEKFHAIKESEGVRRKDVMLRWFRVVLGRKDSAGSGVSFRVFEWSIEIDSFCFDESERIL